MKRNADVFSSTQETILRLHGGYGPIHERGLIATLARRSHCPEGAFHVIHVHDWMTYPAGILVRKLR
ncbi:MAG: hypothetical protein ACLR7Z_02205 [Bilophila wadsworthia]